jgi:N-acetylneuraminic acid mutarotase
MKTGAAMLLFLAGAIPRLAWEDRHAMPEGVGGGATAVMDGTLVYAGGASWTHGAKRWRKEVHVYHIASNHWQAGPPLPVPLAYGASVKGNGALEIFGGTDGTRVYRDCWRLESGRQSWQRAGEAPRDTLLGRAERVDGRDYLFGGCSDVADLTRCTDDVQVREADGGWRKVSRMPQGAIAMPASATVRGLVYLFGGCSMPKAGRLVNRAEAYAFDPRSGRWQRLKDLPRANRDLTAAVLEDRYILLFGGYTASQEEAAGKPPDFGFSSAVLAYDVEKETYTDLTPMPLAVAGMEMLVEGNFVYGMGGENRMRDRTSRLLAARIRR